MMLEDSLMVPTLRRHSEVELKHSLYAPKHDTRHLAPLLSECHGAPGPEIIADDVDVLLPPFMLARTSPALSHRTNGRVEWNIVTYPVEPPIAQNFGRWTSSCSTIPVTTADEFVEIAELLWDSWGDDAGWVTDLRDGWAAMRIIPR